MPPEAKVVDCTTAKVPEGCIQEKIPINCDKRVFCSTHANGIDLVHERISLGFLEAVSLLVCVVSTEHSWLFGRVASGPLTSPLMMKMVGLSWVGNCAITCGT